MRAALGGAPELLIASANFVCAYTLKPIEFDTF